MRVMGVDLGTRTIGLAVSDEGGVLAQPLKTIRRQGWRKDLAELIEVVDEYGVETIVVGLPINMNGTLGPGARKVEEFVERLRERTGVRVRTWDERLSTVAVTRVLIAGDVSRKKRKGVVDKMAAAYILQGYLDSLPTSRDE